MTEYNKELEYPVFYYDEGESYDGYNDESIGVLVPENTSNAEYARNYFSYFSENNPCSYISMLAYRLLGHFRDVYDKVYDDDPDFYDFCRMCIVFLSEREVNEQPTNVQLGVDNKLYKVDDSVAGFLCDLETLIGSFNYFIHNKMKVRNYFVLDGEKYTIKLK